MSSSGGSSRPGLILLMYVACLCTYHFQLTWHWPPISFLFFKTKKSSTHYTVFILSPIMQSPTLFTTMLIIPYLSYINPAAPNCYQQQSRKAFILKSCRSPHSHIMHHWKHISQYNHFNIITPNPHLQITSITQDYQLESCRSPHTVLIFYLTESKYPQIPCYIIITPNAPSIANSNHAATITKYPPAHCAPRYSLFYIS